VKDARKRANAGDLAFGTVDTWLINRLSGGKAHVTDVSNASRTLMYDIRRQKWDDEILKKLRVPAALLPAVKSSSEVYAETDPDLFGAPIPIAGDAGDQQAALFGQACFRPGMMKNTYGTGCFLLMNTGEKANASKTGLLTTIAWRANGGTEYALEGSVFIAGAAVQWLRDGLKIITTAEQSGALAQAADPSQEVVLVPAFVGMGAPHWRPEVRGAMFGLTRATGPRELARAALESVCFQTADLLAAMKDDWHESTSMMNTLRVDGGMAVSDWTMQRLADILGNTVDRPQIKETTALGAAYLAGLHTGFFPEPDRFLNHWRLERRFEPRMEAKERARRLADWSSAVRRLLS
jgi:glycerol kinase